MIRSVLLCALLTCTAVHAAPALPSPVTTPPGNAAKPAAQPRAVTSAALSMPLVRQTYNNCGAASLSMMLAYWGISATQTDISPFVRATPKSYMPITTVAPYVARYNLRTSIVRNATINTIRNLVAAGLPALVLSDLDAPGGIPHWRVASGFDDATGTVIFHDPMKGYVAFTYADFERLWVRHAHLLLVIHPDAQQQAVKHSVAAS